MEIMEDKLCFDKTWCPVAADLVHGTSWSFHGTSWSCQDASKLTTTPDAEQFWDTGNARFLVTKGVIYGRLGPNMVVRKTMQVLLHP
jgi:hypothetical protein